MLLFQVLSSQMFKLYHTKTIYWRYYNIHDVQNVHHLPRGFNGSVNIPESCDFRSQFDPLNIIV